ncbi:hypothetical protein SAMN05216412_101340 [Nitrosospira multiformis]|uniref:Uncharacterized protein n=1 Tax=Nitrosospira multiformis TaxID=1231 RepID=A0A1H9YQX6_9PROT|nr:hypothetical protein SAMN05216412_101340 [Nitrosospira multiformis]
MSRERMGGIKSPEQTGLDRAVPFPFINRNKKGKK